MIGISDACWRFMIDHLTTFDKKNNKLSNKYDDLMFIL